MAGSISKMRAAVDKINAAQPGYDQSQRWTFYNKGTVIKGKECDCSSVCGAIIQMGGYPIDLTGTFYTGNFNEKAKKAGWKEIPFKSVKDVRVGDAINAPGKHVEFCYGERKGHDGIWWFSARNDEKGGSSGGKAGDQGGRENVGFGRPYDMSKKGTRKAYILRPPAPPVAAIDTKKPSNFEFGCANLQAERFGGTDDGSSARGKFLQEMGCSVYSLQEVSEEARYAIRDALPGGRKRWLLEEVGYVCVLWDSTKWDYKGTDRVGFGTPYHGAVRANLVRKANGQKMDIIAVHVRPNDSLTGDDAAKLKAKKGDIQKAINLDRDGVYTVLAGDFNTSHARAYLSERGYKPVNDHVDTVDKVGDQKLDGIYVSTKPAVPIRAWKLIDPGKISDHKTLKGSLTVPGSVPLS